MAALETLEILIEADRSGLESQLKRAGSSIQQFVNSMNKQEVSWTQILSKSITPALIAGIASTFAIAVSQALQFQNAMQQSSLTAKDSFANNSAGMSDAIYDMSSQTGKSATDIAAALGLVNQYFKDTATAQGILNVINQEASIRNMSVLDTAKMLVPLFRQWGINDAPSASQATAVLNESVKQGTISFSDLIAGLTSAGPALRQYTSLADAAAQTELSSVLPGMDSATALQALSAVAGGVQDPLAKINLLMGNMKTIVSDTGISGAFAIIADKIQKAGGVAQELYQQVGLNADAITHFQQTSVPALDGVKAASDSLIKSTDDLGTQVQKNMTITKELAKAWATFNAELQKFIIPGALKELLDIIQGLDIVMQGLNETIADPKGALKLMASGDFWKAMADNFSEIEKNLTGLLLPGSGAVTDWLSNLFSGGDSSKTPVQNGGGQANMNVTINQTFPSSGDPRVDASKTIPPIKEAIHR